MAGIGDVLAITRMAWGVHTKFIIPAKDAPEEFKQLGGDLFSVQQMLIATMAEFGADLKNAPAIWQSVIRTSVADIGQIVRHIQQMQQEVAPNGKVSGLLDRASWALNLPKFTDFRQRLAASINLLNVSISGAARNEIRDTNRLLKNILMSQGGIVSSSPYPTLPLYSQIQAAGNAQNEPRTASGDTSPGDTGQKSDIEPMLNSGTKSKIRNVQHVHEKATEFVKVHEKTKSLAGLDIGPSKLDQQLKDEFEKSMARNSKAAAGCSWDWLQSPAFWIRNAMWWLLKCKWRRKLGRELASSSESLPAPIAQAHLDLCKAKFIVHETLRAQLHDISDLADRIALKNLASDLEGEFVTLQENLSNDYFFDLNDPRYNADLYEHSQRTPEVRTNISLLDDDTVLSTTFPVAWEEYTTGNILFRGFVKAETGEPGWSNGLMGDGTYMLMLRLIGGKAAPQVTICDQSGSLSLTADFHSPGIENGDSLLQHIKFRRKGPPVEIKFFSEIDLKEFLRVQHEHLESAWDRLKPLGDEVLIFRGEARVDKYLCLPQNKLDTQRKPVVPFSAEVLVYESKGERVWNSTRRMVLVGTTSLLKDESGKLMFWYINLFMPLSRVQVKLEKEYPLALRWSDCRHERTGYPSKYPYFCNPGKPTTWFDFTFVSGEDTERFGSTILSLTTPLKGGTYQDVNEGSSDRAVKIGEESLDSSLVNLSHLGFNLNQDDDAASPLDPDSPSMKRLMSWHSSGSVSSLPYLIRSNGAKTLSRRIYTLPVGEAGSSYHALFLVKKSTEGWEYADIYLLAQPSKFKATLGTSSLELKGLYDIDYMAKHRASPFGPIFERPQCEKIFRDQRVLSIDFPGVSEAKQLLEYVYHTPGRNWQLRGWFSGQVVSQDVSRRHAFRKAKSEAREADISYWVEPRNHPIAQLVICWKDSRNAVGNRWMSLSIIEKSLRPSDDGTSLDITEHKALEVGTELDSRTMKAKNPTKNPTRDEITEKTFNKMTIKLLLKNSGTIWCPE